MNVEISFFTSTSSSLQAGPQLWNLGFGQGDGQVLTGSPRPGAFSHLSPRLSARLAVECSDGFDLQQGGNLKARHLYRRESGAEADGLWAVLAPVPAWTSLLLNWDWRLVSSWLMARADVALAARQAWAREEPQAQGSSKGSLGSLMKNTGPRQGGPASASQRNREAMVACKVVSWQSRELAAWRLGIRQTWVES